MPIRVLHIIGSLGLGGAQVCLKYLVEHGSNSIEHVIYPLRNTTDIDIQGNVISYQYRNYDPRKFLAILSLIDKYDIRVVHAHLHKPIMASLLLPFFRKVKVIVHEHGSIGCPGLQYSIYRLFLRLLHSKADLFIAVSKTTASWLQEVGVPKDKVRIVYNAVNPSTFNPQSHPQDQARRILGLSPDATVIGFVGRLVFDKGADLLIEALDILKSRDIVCVLVLAGTGDQRHSLDQLVTRLDLGDRVRFLGFRKDVPTVIAACDIGVVPSRFEPFGMTALEFMQMKVPIVCSGVDGLSEFVEDGHTALVPPANTPVHLAQCIEELIRDPLRRQALAVNAYNHAQGFGMAHQAEMIHRLYVEALSVRSTETNPGA